MKKYLTPAEFQADIVARQQESQARVKAAFTEGAKKVPVMGNMDGLDSAARALARRETLIVETDAEGFPLKVEDPAKQQTENGRTRDPRQAGYKS